MLAERRAVVYTRAVGGPSAGTLAAQGTGHGATDCVEDSVRCRRALCILARCLRVPERNLLAQQIRELLRAELAHSHFPAACKDELRAWLAFRCLLATPGTSWRVLQGWAWGAFACVQGGFEVAKHGFQVSAMRASFATSPASGARSSTGLSPLPHPVCRTRRCCPMRLLGRTTCWGHG